jgi:hypothetical protein
MLQLSEERMDELLQMSEPREEEGDEFRWPDALAPDDLRRRRRRLPRRAFQPTRYSFPSRKESEEHSRPDNAECEEHSRPDDAKWPPTHVQQAASDYADRVIAGAAAPSRKESEEHFRPDNAEWR